MAAVVETELFNCTVELHKINKQNSHTYYDYLQDRAKAVEEILRNGTCGEYCKQIFSEEQYMNGGGGDGDTRFGTTFEIFISRKREYINGLIEPLDLMLTVLNSCNDDTIYLMFIKDSDDRVILTLMICIIEGAFQMNYGINKDIVQMYRETMQQCQKVDWTIIAHSIACHIINTKTSHDVRRLVIPPNDYMVNILATKLPEYRIPYNSIISSTLPFAPDIPNPLILAFGIHASESAYERHSLGCAEFRQVPVYISIGIKDIKDVFARSVIIDNIVMIENAPSISVQTGGNIRSTYYKKKYQKYKAKYILSTKYALSK
jgi:hypothetical protein